MLSIKHGVTLIGLQPQVVLAAIAAHAIFQEYGVEMVITSGNDGQHSTNSKHYSGCAIDIRTRTLLRPKVDGENIAARLDTALGRDFDVLFEGDHIHIEYDPRRPL